MHTLPSLRDISWSDAEKKVARRAFDQARRKQYAAVLARVKKMTEAAVEPADIWQIHDYLSIQRKTIDQTYDYRYSVLIEVFARLLRQNWLSEDDLAGLKPDKIELVKRFADPPPMTALNHQSRLKAGDARLDS